MRILAIIALTLTLVGSTRDGVHPYPYNFREERLSEVTLSQTLKPANDMTDNGNSGLLTNNAAWSQGPSEGAMLPAN